MPRAARSEQQAVAVDARVWRAVESQHVISTMRLVNNDPADQKVLEEILESAKPPVPANARHLHWLLAPRSATRRGLAAAAFARAASPGFFTAPRCSEPPAPRPASGNGVSCATAPA